MSIVITTDVFCDVCTDWIFGCTGSKTKVREAREKAKRAGWIRGVDPSIIGGKSDICPDCAKKENQTNG